MADAGRSMGDAIRKGVGMVHGTGEAIRGNVNAALDSASGDRQSAARHEAIASRGVDEMEHGYHRKTGVGVTPAGLDHEQANPTAQRDYRQTGSMDYSVHGRREMEPGVNPTSGYHAWIHGPAPSGFGPGRRRSSDGGYYHERDGPGKYGTQQKTAGYQFDPPSAYGCDHDPSHWYGPGSEGSHNAPLYRDYGTADYAPHQSYAANRPARVDQDPNRGDNMQGNYGSSGYGHHSTGNSSRRDPGCSSDSDRPGMGIHGELKIAAGAGSNVRGQKYQHEPPTYSRHGTMPANRRTDLVYSVNEPYNPNVPYGRDEAYDKNESYGSNGLYRKNGPYAYQAPQHDRPAKSNIDRHQRSDSTPHLHHGCGPDGDVELDAYERRTSKAQQHPPHANRFLNLLDPGVGDMAPVTGEREARKGRSADDMY